MDKNVEVFDPNKFAYSKLYSKSTSKDRILLYGGWFAACKVY